MKFFGKKISFSLISVIFLIIIFLPALALADPPYLLNPGDVSGSVQNIIGGGNAQQAGAGVSTVKTGLETTAVRAGLKTSETDLPTIAGRAINYLFSIIGVIFLTITLVGGYLWMTAGGNEEAIKKAKGFIINGINGMIVIFLAYALVYVMLYTLKRAVGG